jgi:hypothetical protein
LIEPNTTGKFTASNALFSHANWSSCPQELGYKFRFAASYQVSYKIIQGGKVLNALPPYLPTEIVSLHKVKAMVDFLLLPVQVLE